MGNRHDSLMPGTGRPVVLVPAPGGLWWILLGGMLAILAPMFGFLIGTMVGENAAGSSFTPVYMGLFIGVLIGSVGVLVAMAGGWKLYKANRERNQEQDRA